MGKSQSKQEDYSDSMRWREREFKIAVCGMSGVGKSSFINAIRGLDDDDEDAAETGIFEAAFYPYQAHFKTTLVDLPGIGTPNFPNLVTYCEKTDLETYDTFLMLTGTRFTQIDLQLAQKIKELGKSFFLIRTKIDQNEWNENRKRNPDVEAMIRKIRGNLYENVKEFGISEDKIFLISNYQKDRWDFSRLIEAILEQLPFHQREALSLPLTCRLSTEKKEKVVPTTYSKEQDSHGHESVAFIERKLGEWKGKKIRFGITGDSGTGKSAFINAIRGLEDDDYANGAAKVDVIEATKVPTEYYHSDNPTICFVDLPGIGTPSYPNISTYCKKVGLKNYDRYLIFTATRFTDYDLELAKKVKSFGKSFFLVRTKIDNDCLAESRKRNFDEKTMLENIKKYCFTNVENYISSEKHVFLISNYDKGKWDFCRLIEAICKCDVTD